MSIITVVIMVKELERPLPSPPPLQNPTNLVPKSPEISGFKKVQARKSFVKKCSIWRWQKKRLPHSWEFLPVSTAYLTALTGRTQRTSGKLYMDHRITYQDHKLYLIHSSFRGLTATPKEEIDVVSILSCFSTIQPPARPASLRAVEGSQSQPT
ncbi:hypothetical protein BO94DRAFT_549983 [Aspergillus sclerotioniger CBS 115572]|uniref:Uncharacterized protein n=1 Tax=Aspergillus sclerotioniger CBS 115572 TaxID=1450535 RepID=A0A317VIA5_9EURO|nr:hypothetical protein BO94DRAFT_549983 [Aspergillus sclerotioniger CBS 115572]PWY73189.1 hypothetical protein BO94DRAFT_549983 [Aspergillus sclerotioniger CBS 115572]